MLFIVINIEDVDKNDLLFLYWANDFKGIDIGTQTIFQPDIPAHFKVIQYVRFQDYPDSRIYCRCCHIEQFSDFLCRHTYIVTGYDYRFAFYGNDISFHDSYFLDVASFELFYTAKACDKIFHILIEPFFCNLRIDLPCLDALASEHRLTVSIGTPFDRNAVVAAVWRLCCHVRCFVISRATARIPHRQAM